MTESLNILLKLQSDLAGLRAAQDQVGSFQEQLKGVTTPLAGISSMLSTVTNAAGIAFSVEGVKRFYGATIEAASRINDLSQRIGISTDAFQAFTQAAANAGLAEDDMTSILGKLNGTLATAATKGGESAEAFHRLGLDAGFLSRIPLEKALEAVAIQMKGATDKTAAYADIVEILGEKNAPKLMAFLDDLATRKYDGLLASAIRIPKEDIDVLDKFGKLMDKMGEMVKAEATSASASTVRFFAPGGGLSQFIGVIENRWGIDGDPGTPASETGRGRIGKPLTSLPRSTIEENKRLIEEQRAQAQESADALRRAAESQERMDIQGRMLLEDQKDLNEENAKTRNHFKQIAELAAQIADPLKADKDLIAEIEKAAAGGYLNLQQAALAIERIRESMVNSEVDRFFEGIDKASSTIRGGPGSMISEYDMVLKRANDLFNDPRRLSPFEGLKTGLLEFSMQMANVGRNIADSISGALNTALSSTTDHLTNVIMLTESWQSALSNIGLTILREIISSIIRMGVQWMLTQVAMWMFGKALKAASLATAIAESAAYSAIWAAPATLSTIASAGATAVLAPGQVQGSIAASQALVFATGGKKDGGFAADGDPNQIGGVYHLGEWIAPQWMVKDPMIGSMINRLEGIRRGGVRTPGFSGGGGTSGASGSVSSSPSVTVNHAFFNTEHEAKNWLRTQSGESYMMDWLAQRGIRAS